MAAVLAFVSAVAACGLWSDREPAQPVQPTDRTGQDEWTATTGTKAESGTTRPGTPRAGAQTEDGRSSDVGRRDAILQGANRRMIVSLLALMTFLAALVEDAPASWSGMYLRHVGANAATAAAGYAAFSTGSVLARLFNDWMVDRIGWARLIRVGTLCCASALTGALLLGTARHHAGGARCRRYGNQRGLSRRVHGSGRAAQPGCGHGPCRLRRQSRLAAGLPHHRRPGNARRSTDCPRPAGRRGSDHRRPGPDHQVDCTSALEYGADRPGDETAEGTHVRKEGSRLAESRPGADNRSPSASARLSSGSLSAACARRKSIDG